MDSKMSIQLLPPEVIAQIRSSITITSLNGVVCELMKNCLDAGPRKITVNVDYGRGGCLVEDDGLGIAPPEFGINGNLGKMYHTSKWGVTSIHHGGQGTFLASLSSMALLSITSHHHLHRSVNTLSMHTAEVISRQTPAPAHHYLSSLEHGTKVTVQDLFGNMPVRVKQRAVTSDKQGGNTKEWEELKRQLVALLLCWPKAVSLTLKNTESKQQVLIRAALEPPAALDSMPSSPAPHSILYQAGFITAEEKQGWVSISASTDRLRLEGAISLYPSATKQIQFFSFGIVPIFPASERNVIQEHINLLFSNSAFGNEEDYVDLDEKERNRRAHDARYNGDGFTTRELKGVKKGVDRWPMFYINIQHSKQSDPVDADVILDEKGNHLSAIIHLLEATILAFLKQHHFRPKAGRGQRSKAHPTSTSNRSPQKRSGTISPIKRNMELSKGTSAVSSRVQASSGIDLFGDAHIRFPISKSNSLNIEHKFVGFSRIKSGIIRIKSPQFDAANIALSIQRPSTAPPSIRGSSASLATTSSPRCRSVTPLVSKEGKLIRPPFPEVITKEPAIFAKISSSTDEVDQNETTVWVNPITKAKNVVNTRTGFSLPERAFKTTDTSTLAIPSRRLTLQHHNKTDNKAPSPWVEAMLRDWENPIYQPIERMIPQVLFDGIGDNTKSILRGLHNLCSQIDVDRAFKETSASLDGRISKDGLRSAEIISQVDKKFILIKVHTAGSRSSNGNGMLVIVDQHAADERIRIEALMAEYCSPSQDPRSGVCTKSLDKPVVLEFSSREINLLASHTQHFADWGILYDVPSNTEGQGNIHKLTITSLPPGIFERCKSDPRLLIDLIRVEVWKVHDRKPTISPSQSNKTWLERIHDCPQGILDLLNSRACRSAIMFNDDLTRDQCEVLVKRLADCVFPFQCAHGRPSLVPLVDIDTIENRFRSGREIRSTEEGFGRSFKRWKDGLDA